MKSDEDFFEEDEPAEKVVEAFKRGEKHATQPPQWRETTGRLCDDDGIVRQGAVHHGTDYPCTGHAHFAGDHITCTSPAHSRAAWIAGTEQRVCGNCGHPVDAPLPFVSMYPGQIMTTTVPANAYVRTTYR